MTSFSKLRIHHRLVNILVGFMVLGVVSVWFLELTLTLGDITKREEKTIQSHQDELLRQKSEDFRDTFNEIFQSTRTISLLPMVRSVSGGNRLNVQEDVVAQGRLSVDTHLTLQQIYTNLANFVSVSEVYYVLDGFDPARHVPFFMYDDLIADTQSKTPGNASHTDGPSNDRPEELEEAEYLYFPTLLDWFRSHAPRYKWARALDRIPVQMSPVLRTCDNAQYQSIKSGNPREANGFIYAMPVFDQSTQLFKGMIVAVIRINVLEARLLGVPFIPVTPADLTQQAQGGWRMPEASPFQLINRTVGIDIHDRRNPVFDAANVAQLPGKGRLAKVSIDWQTGANWELSHYLSAADLAQLAAPFETERQRAMVGRIGLIFLLLAMIGGTAFMVTRSRRELMRLAHFDSLTSLPNRRLFFDRLAQGLVRAQRSRSPLALFFVDVAGFNAINDTYGHQGGDELLVGIAGRLQRVLRGSDSVDKIGPTNILGSTAVSRLGGDEFTLVCEDIRQPEDIAPLAERLIAAMRTPFAIGESSVEVRINLGIAVYPNDAPDCDKLLACADVAMHECQRQGLDYFLYNLELRGKSERQHLLAVELGMALKLGQFEVFYQPKASLVSGKVVSLEALLRWRHPELGMISPVEFIPILERTGGILEIGAWVLEQSCRDLARLKAAGFERLKISVNVSVRQLRRGNFHEIAGEIATRTQTAPASLVLEITESVVMEDFAEGNLLMHKLVDLGFALSIDDFGTGYSSLTYLQNLPLHYLKLDIAFIDGMTDPRSQHIVETVIRLARGLNLTTIAEGIETVAQRDALAAVGCDIMQGYLLAKPMPMSSLIPWLAEHPCE